MLKLCLNLFYHFFLQNQILPAVSVVSADFGNNTTGIKFTGDATVKAFTGGAGNDTLIGDAATTSINAGAGNDLVSLAAGATVTNVTLGAGADTLDISAVICTIEREIEYIERELRDYLL